MVSKGDSENGHLLGDPDESFPAAATADEAAVPHLLQPSVYVGAYDQMIDGRVREHSCQSLGPLPGKARIDMHRSDVPLLLEFLVVCQEQMEKDQAVDPS